MLPAAQSGGRGMPSSPSPATRPEYGAASGRVLQRMSPSSPSGGGISSIEPTKEVSRTPVVWRERSVRLLPVPSRPVDLLHLVRDAELRTEVSHGTAACLDGAIVVDDDEAAER